MSPVGPRRKSSEVRFCAAVRDIADIRRACLHVVNPQRHCHGDPIDGEIGIVQLGAGLGELADLVDIGRAEHTFVVKRAVPLLSVVFTQLTNVSCSAFDIQIVCVMVPTLSPGRGRWRVLPPSMSVEIGSSIRWIG